MLGVRFSAQELGETDIQITAPSVHEIWLWADLDSTPALVPLSNLFLQLYKV